MRSVMDKLRANKGHRRNGLRHGAFAPAAGFLALAMATSPELCAEERKMTAIQIFEALAGNTVVGAWGRKPYRAYFRPDGLTILQANRPAGWQTVPHVHVHVLPRHRDDGVGLTWPRKEPGLEALRALAARIDVAD